VDDDDATVDSVDSVFSFDTMDSSLSLETLFDFESSASMSTTESYLSEASLDSVVDTMVGETIRCDCDIDFCAPSAATSDVTESNFNPLSHPMIALRLDSFMLDESGMIPMIAQGCFPVKHKNLCHGFPFLDRGLAFCYSNLHFLLSFSRITKK
jgi:hypothetical protein